MKNIVSKFLVLFSIASLLVACEKDAEITTQAVVTYPVSAVVSASASSIVLTKANDASEVVTFTLPSVNYGYTDKVSYSLQFDIPADTISGTPWGNAKTVIVGEKLLSKTMLGSELNSIAVSLGMDTSALGSMIVRAVGIVDRNVYSKAVTIAVKPYKEIIVVASTIWIQGEYQGWTWSPSVATIVSLKGDGMHEGYVYFPADKGLAWKMYAQADWSPMSYGDGLDSVLIIANYAGGNFAAPSAGYYEISANLNTMRYTQTLTTWGILGDATPGGWTTDTQLTYDATTQVWSVTADMLSTGSFKFRANNDWKIDFGIDANGKLQYADNPLFPYNATINNITVPTSGNYTITLDLHVAGEYTYSLTKN